MRHGNFCDRVAYDPVGQLLQTSQSVAGAPLRQVSATYTRTGKISTTTDANGKGITRYAYDVNDRIASTTDPVRLGRSRQGITVHSIDTSLVPALRR